MLVCVFMSDSAQPGNIECHPLLTHDLLKSECEIYETYLNTNTMLNIDITTY